MIGRLTLPESTVCRIGIDCQTLRCKRIIPCIVHSHMVSKKNFRKWLGEIGNSQEEMETQESKRLNAKRGNFSSREKGS